MEESDLAGDAPPKLVARAMDRLGRAARLVADIRLGADRLLEALLAAEEPRQLKKCLQFVLEEDASMRQRLHDLRNSGRLLQESGVLDGSVESSGNSWSLQLPLVCPDGAVVGYAWRRQLAGQAGTSAVDRTRLALKTFHDQKRRYFPHLEEDEPVYQPSPDEIRVPKKLRSYATNSISTGILPEGSTLFDILVEFSREIPGVRISTYRRMEWLGRASSQSLSEDGEQFGHNSDMYSGGSLDAAASGQAVVIELLAPSVFRAILSLHPAGSTIPDAVSFFSPDEWGNHVNARGVSSYQVYRYITEHAGKTLQCFLSSDPDIALHCLLRWVSSYQALFSETCRKCKKLLSNDRNLNLILPQFFVLVGN